jgi:hypothetical protein
MKSEMPFGLAILNKYCIAYLDDIIIYSPIAMEYVKHLELAFDLLCMKHRTRIKR